MAQSIFDALTGVSLDSPSVQSLIESQNLITEVEQSAIDQDEEDIFQCGKCKSQFTSLHMFVLHKRTHQKTQEQTVDLSQFLVNDESHIIRAEDTSQDESQYNPQETFVRTDQLGGSIILEETDMLFSMDQENGNYFTTDSTFSVPIILSSEGLDTFTNSGIIGENESMKNESKEISQILQSDISQEENLINSINCKTLSPDTVSIELENVEQAQNLKVPPDGSIDRTYHCQFCKEIFDSYKALKGHLIVSHLALKVYKCVQSSCSMMFAELEDFLEHTRSHKRSEYRCHVCGEVFNTLSDLGLHQYAHSVQKQKTTEKYYCCSICKSSFSNLEALQHHTETTTHDYACLHCGKSFLIERFLRRHLKTHASSARFACEDCGKAFKTEQYLANHKLIHSEETPFLCPHCPARFKRKDRLGRHMLIHDLTKRLKCPFRGYLGCMSEFSRPDKLKRHLLTHSNIKRFSCSHCNRNFHRAQALKHHEMNKHSLKCDICSHAFKTKDQLITHNCDQSIETKKHTSSQLPKKASGSFKPRKPTPKRQMSSKTAIGVADKEKLEKFKADEIQRKITSEMLKSNDSKDDSSIKKIGSNQISRDIGSTIEALIRSDSTESEIKRNSDIYTMHQAGE
ncbi:Zinc finger protein 341 [Vespula maculifrons]|uniref:Zinc finger protein 341 n=1 Tax=Vespula maculifrons TaxID=7453 RepID=A0ABD2CU90_VESMC